MNQPQIKEAIALVGVLKAFKGQIPLKKALAGAICGSQGSFTHWNDGLEAFLYRNNTGIYEENLDQIE